jgi:uncharacterized protein (TIGR02231 family)
MSAHVEQCFPPFPTGARVLPVPVTEVTLLEDRAQVRRRARVRLAPGQNRVVVKDVSPVLQDVSLRAEVVGGGGRVADARVRRAMRVSREEQPGLARELEEAAHALRKEAEAVAEDREVALERWRRVGEMLTRGLAEIPEDASWGQVNHQAWHDTFDALFKRARKLRETVLGQQFALAQMAERMRDLVKQRQAVDRPDTRFVAWMEIDVLGEADADADAEVELVVDYTVPNAVWRPLHAARLVTGGNLTFTCSAAVWQNTGEDWEQAALLFSTGRSSLGTEPPLLGEDHLQVQKKAEQVVIEAREVAIQKASVGPAGGGGPSRPAGPRAVDLPGVDDGGEVRNLKAPSPCSVPSDGRPNVIPLFTFDAEANTSLVAFPELEPKAFLRSLQRNTATFPVLAGPVELLRDNGFVGWTQVMFVAPGEEFQLSFGPDDAIRITRQEKSESDLREADKWTVHAQHVTLYLSNLSGGPKHLEVTERIPVSEIEQVKVELNKKKTTGKPAADAHGFLAWKVELAPNSQEKLDLFFTVSTAPGVQGF